MEIYNNVRSSTWSRVLIEKLLYLLNKSIKKLFKFYFVRKYISYKQKLANQSGVECVFFSRTVDVIKDSSGMEFDRFIDPMVDLFSTSFGCMKINLPSINKKFSEKSKLSYFLGRKELIGGKLMFSSSLKTDDSLNGISELSNIYYNITGNTIDERWVLKQSKEIEIYALIFQDLLFTISPKIVFLVCYYYPLAMGLVLACKRLNISVVDIQHGQQSKYHPMYNSWNPKINENYELLPDYLWRWNDNIKKLELSCPINSVFGGNLWPVYWNNNREKFMSSSDFDFINTIKKKYNKIILYACQGTKRYGDNLYFPDYVIEVMKNSPDDWCWMVRLHPGGEKDCASVIKYLSEKGVKNFDVMFSTRVTLFELIELSSYCLTVNSSTCLDAVIFKCQVIIVGKMGYDSFYNYINEGIFHYAITYNKIFAIIDEDIVLDNDYQEFSMTDIEKIAIESKDLIMSYL